MKAAALLLAAALAFPVQAGRPCEAKLPESSSVMRGLGLAERTARQLDASGAEVVVLARAGQDLSRWRLRWSHLAFAYRVAPPNDEAPGTWRVVHKLNHCGTPDAALYRQGLGQFFLDRPHRHEAAWVELSAEAQARLLPLLRDNQAVARLHEPRYNMVAYPWATRYQQSNQWVLETLAGAMDPDAVTRRQAQAWLQRRGYQPTVLRIGPLTRLGANVTRGNIAFDDHPNEKRFSDRIETVSVESVFDWLARAGLADGSPSRTGL
jgi:hypothetical protein